jgi:plastocyanin
MMKLVRNCIAVIMLVALMAMAVACGEDEDEADTTPAPSATSDSAGTGNGTAGDVVEVEMKDISFMPEEITVKVNSKVRWTNEDPVAHTVTDDEEMFDSGVMSGDGTMFEHQYDEPGTYDYTCTIHPTSMTGTVVVEE